MSKQVISIEEHKRIIAEYQLAHIMVISEEEPDLASALAAIRSIDAE